MNFENETLQSQALGLDMSDMMDYDPSQPPKNGNHYLYNVMSEAAKCPRTVVADLSEIERKVKKQTVFVEQEKLPSCNPDFIPSEEWQLWQIADFKNMRSQVSKWRLVETDAQEKEIVLPDYSDERGWFKYCMGKESSKEHLPLVSTLISMSQKIYQAEEPQILIPKFFLDRDDEYRRLELTFEKLLIYFLRWLERGEVTFGRTCNLWLYSILAFLETPLTPDVCFLLRNLARHCLNHRAKIVEENEETLKAVNLLICIVTRYFGQLDLLD